MEKLKTVTKDTDKGSFSEDICLWNRILNGDQNALSKLFRKYYSPLLNYGLKLIPQENLIKDSIQELFSRIWERRGRLSEVEYVRTYLYTSLRRTMFNQTKIQKVRNQRNRSYAAHKLEDKEAFSQETKMILNEIEAVQKEKLKEALENLNTRTKEVIFLKFYSGLSNTEIAEVMGITRQSVYNYVYRAIEALSIFMDNEK